MKADKVTLSIPETMTGAAKAKAALESTSMSAVVRGLLQLWLDGLYPTPRKERGQLELIPADAGAEIERLRVDLGRVKTLKGTTDQLMAQLESRIAEIERMYSGVADEIP